MLDKNLLQEKCLFCEPGAHGQTKQILLRSDNFYLFAGLGPMVEGYIIIAPHRCDNLSSPFNSFSDIPADLLDEALYLRGLISAFYRDVYSQEASMHFEHGRAGVCFPGGTPHCYHAHLCCYPCSFPLWEDMDNLSLTELKTLPELKKRVGNSAYLLVQSSSINYEAAYDTAAREYWLGYVAIINDESRIVSQYLRRLLAARLGNKYIWDWAATPQPDLVEKLITSFSKWLLTTNRYEIMSDPNGIPQLSFLKSVEKSNQVGNDNVSRDFHETWSGKEQYGALGRFLSKFSDNLYQRPRVLDVGCGPGHYVKIFSTMGIECVGIDISDEMIEIARQVIGESERYNDLDRTLSFPRIDKISISQLDFEAESFDGIWYSAALVHMPRIQALTNIARLYQVLKQDGVMYISAQIGSGAIVRREGRVFFYYDEDELKHLFHEAGFVIIEQWGGETNIGSKGDTRKKPWMHFLLKKATPLLSDLGERELLERVRHLVPKITKEHIVLGIGDDCASIRPMPGEVIVTTIDPCPQPVITMLGENDRWYDGWFSMIINLSDLGSMGARPLGMMLAIEAEKDMHVKEFDRFYEGVTAASEEFDCPIIGGNLKDAPRFNCVGAAIGSVHPDKMLRRSVAEPGERVVVLGEVGKFWAGIIHKLENISLTQEESAALMAPLRKPRPRIFEGQALASHGLARCAIDSSDGLIACFYEIARASTEIDIVLDFARVRPDPAVSKVADLANIDVRKIMLSWGNWELVTTVPEDKLDKLQQVMDSLGCPVNIVGMVYPGNGNVLVHDRHSVRRLNYVASERFTKRSYFSYGLENYLQTIRREPLTLPN